MDSTKLLDFSKTIESYLGVDSNYAMNSEDYQFTEDGNPEIRFEEYGKKILSHYNKSLKKKKML